VICGLFGKTRQAHYKQLWSEEGLVIRPSNKFAPVYLLYVLTSKSFKETLENEAKGVTMANLNKGIINNLLIPIPPIKLQHQFAAMVAETEQLRQRQRVHEQELDQLFKGLLQKCLVLQKVYT
jgi:type I restriction enzyme S subunit